MNYFILDGRNYAILKTYLTNLTFFTFYGFLKKDFWGHRLS